MKLDRLKIFKEELDDEISLDKLKSSIYYHYNEAWSNLDVDADFSEEMITNLNKIKKEKLNLQIHPHLALYNVDSMDCQILLSSKNEIDLSEHVNLEDVLKKIERRAMNAYRVCFNPMTQLLAKDSFKSHLKKAVDNVISHEDKFNDESQFYDQDESQIRNESELLAVLAIDIDHFKQINDTFGHIYGDQVLKTFALRLEKCSKRIKQENDIEIYLSHPSGEEFWILIHGVSTKNKIISWANEFRTDICNTPLPSNDEWDNLCKEEDLESVNVPFLHERNVSASFGLFFFSTTPGINVNVNDILESADTALYRAKASGRNQVTPFEDILNDFGRIIEHDESSNVVVIDIGTKVGVLKGQEFKVYLPNYTGRKSFSIHDGRTSRVLGNYPRLMATTITVFDAQPELSFAFINDPSERLKIDIGSVIEAIPSGSFGHLLTNTPRHLKNLPGQSYVSKMDELKEFIHSELKKKGKVFSLIFRFSSGNEFLKNYGSASLNEALAKLFNQLASAYNQTSRFGIVDTSAICIVGSLEQFNTEKLKVLSNKLKSEFRELGLKIGAYVSPVNNKNTKENIGVDEENAIELSRFAASDYAANNKKDVVYFDHDTALQILKNQREQGKYSQALADFEKLQDYGVISARIFNQAGLLSSSVGNVIAAEDFYEKAVNMDKDNKIYKSNLCSALYRNKKYELAVEVMSSISDEDLENLLNITQHGYALYARVLAKIKTNNLSGFDENRFRKMAKVLSTIDEIKGTKAMEEINSALHLIG